MTKTMSARDLYHRPSFVLLEEIEQDELRLHTTAVSNDQVVLVGDKVGSKSVDLDYMNTVKYGCDISRDIDGNESDVLVRAKKKYQTRNKNDSFKRKECCSSDHYIEDNMKRRHSVDIGIGMSLLPTFGLHSNSTKISASLLKQEVNKYLENDEV